MNLGWLPIATVTLSGLYAGLAALYRAIRDDHHTRKETEQ